jgi:hypothetical protein
MQNEVVERHSTDAQLGSEENCVEEERDRQEKGRMQAGVFHGLSDRALISNTDMDDIAILAKARWQIRRAVKLVNQVLSRGSGSRSTRRRPSSEEWIRASISSAIT